MLIPISKTIIQGKIEKWSIELYLLDPSIINAGISGTFENKDGFFKIK